MQESYSGVELSNILQISARIIRKKAREGKLPCTERPNPRGGGIVKVYAFVGLPKEWQEKISAYTLERALVPANVNLTNTNKHEQTSTKRIIPEKAEAAGLAKYKVVQSWREVIETQPHGKKGDATEAFLLAYNTGKLLAGVYGRLGEICESTLRDLDKRLRESRPENNGNEDYRVLCDGRGGWRIHGTTHWRKRALCDAAKDAFLTCWLRPEQPTVSLAIRAARTVLERKGIVEESDDRTWRRWLDDWSKRSQHIIVLAREGEKAYRDKIGPYISRDTSQLTVGQVLVADGHDLNFEIIHPQTGKPARLKLIMFFDWASRMPVGWQIMPTENTAAISAALRNAILNLGNVPDVVYLDNGKAFKSRFFTETDPDLTELTGLYARLGTATCFAAPYNARAKVVERFFLTMQEQFERLMPSFCGASIGDKPAWRSRNEKFHRSLHEKRTGGFMPNIREAAWLLSLYVEWYGRQPHAGLGGRSPADVLDAGRGSGVDAAQLDREFLWSKKVSPRRCRVTLYGIDYESDCLHGWGDDAIARYDTADLSRIFLYTLDGSKLGEALPVQALSPIAKMLGDQVSVDQVAGEIKRQRRLAKETKINLIELGADPEHVESLDALPWNRRVAVLPGGKEEKIHHRDTAGTEETEIDQAEKARLELVVSNAAAEIEARAQSNPALERPSCWRSEHHRYEWAWRAVHEHKAEIGYEDAAFMTYFESTQEFEENYAGRYQSLAKLYP